MNRLPSSDLCRSCRQPVVWIVLTTKKGRRKPPLDPMSSDELGTILYVWGHDKETGEDIGKVASTSERGLFTGHDLLYVSHFESCSNPDTRGRKR